MTTRQRWERVSELLNDALELPAVERDRFLDQQCGGDADLRREVEELVAGHESDDDFLPRPFFTLVDPPADEDPDLGRRIGPYRLVRRIGRGGMGAVFLAERVDGEVEQRVAIKLLRPGGDSGGLLRRFYAERQLLADLAHPNVARLLDAGTSDDGLPYLVMEHVDGRPVDQHCDRLRLTVRERVRLFRTVCDAVAFVHRNAVIHRDLKPANILVTAEGEVKLLDFGIAKLKRHDRRLALTATSATAPMTPRYASPEQVTGAPVDTTSDVYSLGTVLYELLAGRRAHRFATTDPRHVAQVVSDRTPPRPSRAIGTVDEAGGEDGAPRLSPEQIARLRRTDPRRLRRELAGDLDNIVMEALRKEPRRRLSSAEQLSGELGRYLEGLPVRSRPDTLAYRTGKFIGRHRWGVVAAAVIMSLLLGIAVVTVTSRARKARIAQEQEIVKGVTAFLVNFLKTADASRTEGRVLTVQEAFDAAADRLGAELADAPEVRATLADAVGGVYRDQDRFSEARPFLEEALALRRAALGGDHPLVGESLHNLANLFLEIGDRERAEELTREAIAIQRRAFSGGNRDLARGLTNFAIMLRRRGKLEEATAVARESLAMKVRLFGPGDREVAYTLNSLALIRWDRRDVEEAEDLYRRTIEIRRAAEPGSKELATALSNLGALLIDVGRTEEALALHEEALDLRRRLYPGGHRDIVVSLSFVGLTKTLLGSYDEASELLARGMAISAELPKRPGWARLKTNQALLLRQTGDLAGCEEASREAVQSFGESQRADVAEARSIGAGCAAAAGRLEEAEPDLLASFETLVEIRGDEARPTRQARRRLVDAYEAWGRPREAARFRAQALP